MKPKYNIWDEYYTLSIYKTENPKVVTWMQLTNYWDISFKYMANWAFSDNEKDMMNKQEYITHLREKASELITLANKLEEDENK